MTPTTTLPAPDTLAKDLSAVALPCVIEYAHEGADDLTDYATRLGKLIAAETRQNA